MLAQFDRAPLGALVFGFGGVAPFSLAALGIYAFSHGWPPVEQNSEAARFLAYLLVLWGGLILAFLGGTRWGRALGGEAQSAGLVTLASASFPSFIAWVGVAVSLPPLGQPGLGASILVGGFVHMLLWDLQGVREGVWPRWYSALRIVLTGAASLALIAGGMAAMGLDG